MFGLLNWLWRLPEKLDAASTAKGNALRVSAGKLLGDFFDNQIAADQQYKNKVVQFESVVHTIRRELGVNVLYCETERGLLRCECAADASNTLGRISKGQKVQVTGKVNGLFFANVVITGCRLNSMGSTSH